jgi:phospho-N-acetylmuramoyl-pentapeptide-transferase
MLSNISVFKILFPSITAFIIGIIITPIITHYLYKYKMWKKKNYESDMFGKATPITAAILNDGERKVPRMGGLVVIFATLITVYIYYFFSVFFFQNDIMQKLNFLSRSQTWVPIAVFILGAIIGLIDDLASTQILNMKSKNGEWGMPLRIRLIFVVFFGFFSG